MEKKVKTSSLKLASFKRYVSPMYNVEYHKDFLDEKESKELYDSILKNVEFSHGEKYDEDNPPKRRVNATYGDEGLVYEIEFKTRSAGSGRVGASSDFKNGKTVKRECIEWEKLPLLLKYKKRIDEKFKSKVTTSTIQLYPNSKIGIKPHRDKEMVGGTKIFGLSLGTKRTLVVDPSKRILDKVEYFRKLKESGKIKTLNIGLENGSLYVFNPPTNDKCTHSIPKDKGDGIRLSLTFRTY